MQILRQERSLVSLLLFALVNALVPQLAFATLIDRGAGMIYDSQQNLTFLQNAQLSGVLSNEDAPTWAADLIYGGYDDWRLPYFFFECPLVEDELDPDFNSPGFGCSNGSELSILYYEVLGNVSIHAGGPTNFGPFEHVVDNPNPSVLYHLQPFSGDSGPWYFLFDTGKLFGDPQFSGYAWAVRAGDVTTVPEPESLVLLLTGLAIAATRKLRRRTSASH